MIHPFGMPDLYDIEGKYGTGNIGGIDRFGVMANQGGNAGGDLSWPGSISAWTRFKLGWINPTVIDTAGNYELRAVEEYPEMFKITKGFENKEYLLIENRQPIDGSFDEKFMDPGGVVIYHIDENIWDVFESNGNFPRGGPFQNDWPGNGKHYPVAVLQADGLYEIEQGINGGKSDDLWNKPSQVLGPGNGEKVVSNANYPNTDSYAFGVIKPTGITIKNFQSKGGSAISFQVCGFSGGDCTDITTPDPDTKEPTKSPTNSPTRAPTRAPTRRPSRAPTKNPTSSPTKEPIEELVNGSCEIAVEAFRPDGSPKGISNITSGSSGDTCYGGEGIGVWYKIDAGTVAEGENTIQANTCFSETNSLNQISVFKGDKCDDLECVETKEIACKNGQRGHVVYWEVDKDEDYHLFVHAIEESEDFSDIDILGDGSLLLDVFNFEPMKNDNCISTTTMSTDGKRVGGSTKRATPESGVTSSDTCGRDSAGVWFKVIGTGSELRATTCHSGTRSSTQIHVFSGTCDSLSCITVETNNYAVCSDLDIATNSATANWETEEGEEYFILVGSRDGNGGVFELSVSEFTPALNDQCPNAVAFEIPDDTSVISGSTEDATNDFPHGSHCGAPLDTAGVWYTIEGTGEGLSVSTCGQNDYDSAISIFTGSDCDELECLAGIATRDPACDFQGVTAAWLSDEDETYHVYVHGSAENSYGTFELEAKKFEVKANNEFCNEAIPIPNAGVDVRGSRTIDAVYSAPTNECGAEAVKPGLWYSFEGTGSPFNFSGCPLTNINVSVSFFSGESCGDLTCISNRTYTMEECMAATNATNADENRFLQSSNLTDYISVESEVGVTYYMVIHGQARPDPETGVITNGVGKFNFTFYSPEPNNSTDDQGGKDSDLSKEGKKFTSKTLVNILIGVGAFFILVFCIPPCWIYREKLCRRCRKSDRNEDGNSGSWWDPTRPPDDLDMEEAPFTDERSTRRIRTKKQVNDLIAFTCNSFTSPYIPSFLCPHFCNH